MPVLVTAAIASAVISGGAAIYGARQERKAAEKSAGAQRKANNKALQHQKDMEKRALSLFKKEQARIEEERRPFLEQQKSRLSDVNHLLENPESVRELPGYEAGLNEGRRTIEGGAAARGGLMAGRTGKALQRFGSDYQDKMFDTHLQRLSSLAGLGPAPGATNPAAGQAAGVLAGSQQAPMIGADGRISADLATAQGNINAGLADTLGNTGGNLANVMYYDHMKKDLKSMPAPQRTTSQQNAELRDTVAGMY